MGDNGKKIEEVDNFEIVGEAIIKEQCKNFKSFVDYIWSVLNPSHPLVYNIAVEAICDHLQAVSDGTITRLIINVPFKFLKSMLCSVFFPAWEWTQRPWLQYLCISNNKQLPIRDNIYTRTIVLSDLYEGIWGDTVKLTSSGKETLTTTAGGIKAVTSSRSEYGTGAGGHRIIYDDPHNALDAFRPEMIKKVITQWNQVISSRLQPGNVDGAIILIMQKICKGDLTDHFKELGGFEHLVLPMEYDPGDVRLPTSLGFIDPRKETNELLCEEIFPLERVEEVKQQLGPFGVATQLQQKSMAMAGAIVDTNDFVRYQELPDTDTWQLVFQAWDTAQNDNEIINSPWVGGTWVVTENMYYLVDVYRDWHKYPEGRRAVMMYWINPPYDTYRYQGFSNPAEILIESKSTGTSLLQELPSINQKLQGRLIPIIPHGSKLQRLYEENSIIRAGKVAIPESAPWLYSFLSELASFPVCEHKDQADMLSMSLKHIRHFSRMQTNDIRWQNTDVVFV